LGEHLFEILRGYFNQHGYWTVALALLLENAGMPVPGETILLFASFLAFSERELHLPYIILIGIAAAATGDNLGYIIGHHGGRPLLERWKHIFHISDRHVRQAEELFRRHGPLTIFFARFIFGMRVIAGPLAGVLRMPWKAFALFNVLGAALWVTVISVVGYLFGRHWNRLLHMMSRVNFIIFFAAVALVWFMWWRKRKRAAEASEEKQTEVKTRD
jgi:membrane protein DedA with SNARE-associated domain